jgi:hypothetical protein
MPVYKGMKYYVPPTTIRPHRSRRHDPERPQTVAAFATHLKDAVDLDCVRTDLTGVVHRALEPAHVSSG